MKYLLIAFAALLMAFTPTASVTFTDVRGTPESDNILIQWWTSQEDGIKNFAVEKASQLDNQFYAIGTVSPTGAGSAYQFSDNGIYKTTSSTIFRYRVRADGIDGSISFSKEITVSYNFSSSLSGVAKRTWGSIKAMFR
ncbi:MAG: hypothetical protein M1470_06895 [Bacteroidetes bacterium]|nr:hypothetical protein [Bacteroidota bacterium]